MKDETKEVLCVVGEWVCETAMGYAAGVITREHILPKCCTKGEKVLAISGTCAAVWLMGRKFAKEFYKFCDGTFGTDLHEQIYDE